MRGLSLILVVILIGAVGAAWADDAPGNGTVLAVVLPGPGADSSLRGIIADAVQVQLLRRNAVAIMARADTESAGTLPEALDLASSQRTQYLLLCTYSTSERRLGLEAELFDVAGSSRIGAGRAEGRVDLSLDEIVARALSTALGDVTFPAQAVAAPDTTGVPGAPVSGDLSPAARRLSLGISAGAAPMIPTGPAAAYADLGLLATATFELRFPVRVGTLSAGILSGACLFSASGASSDAFVALVPLGIDAGLRLGRDGIGVAIHLGGGPALMATTAPAVSTLLKIVPYALAGMSLELPFSAALGLSVQASYALFFESAALPIMAFAPEVSLYARF